VRRAPLAALVLASALVLAADPAIAPFSTALPGPRLPGQWREQYIRDVTPSRVELADDDGMTVLEVRSRNSAGAAMQRLRAPTVGASLAWRWKIDRIVETADMDRREGDDFPARVYVFFDVPIASLSVVDRAKLRVSRWFHGQDVPTAAICYVWDNRHARGTSRWSPYTSRVRMVVLETGREKAGRWVEEKRDLAADFQAAFGSQWKGPPPPITGVAAGNDTDQTGETATARFGDLRIERGP
jgi:hypothetical protein